MKKFIRLFMLMILLTVIAKSSIDGRYFTVQSVIDVTIPYNPGDHIPSIILLGLNIGLNYLFIYYMLEIVDSLFEMESYVLTRGTNDFFYKAYLRLILKESTLLSIIYFLSSAIFTLRDGTGIIIVLQLAASVLLTLIILANIFFLLKTYRTSMKKTFFLVFSGLILFQILSGYYPIFSWLVVGSLYFKEYIEFIFVGKTIVIIILTFLCWFRSKKYESYGGYDD